MTEVAETASGTAGDYLFWRCPNTAHAGNVALNGPIACCTACGITSDDTDRLIGRAQASQRSQDVLHLQQLASLIADGGDSGTFRSPAQAVVPDQVVAAAAEYLATTPAGNN